MKYEKIELKNINQDDFRFLYTLLQERDPKANISHKKLPSYEEHVQFIESEPYEKWYIVYCDEIKVGSIYLSKQNEIGIFIKKEYHKQNIKKIILNELIRRNNIKLFLANVSPENYELKNFFVQQNFILIQNTYELDLRKNNNEI